MTTVSMAQLRRLEQQLRGKSTESLEAIAKRKPSLSWVIKLILEERKNVTK